MSFLANPLVVVFTDSRGYALEGEGSGETLGTVLPVVLCNKEGYVLDLPAAGAFISGPVPVVLTNYQGYELTTGAATGEFFRGPLPVCLCSSSGAPSLDLPSGSFVRAPLPIVAASADGRAIPGFNPFGPAPSDPPVLLAHAVNSNGLSSVTTAGVDTSGASLLVVAFCSYYGTDHAKTISDSKSNNWHLLTEYDAAGNHSNPTASMVLAYAYDSGSGDPLQVGTGHTVTGAIATGDTGAIAFQAWSNTLTTSAVYKAASDTGITASTGGAGTLFQVGSSTPDGENDLVISGIGFVANSDPGVDSGLSLSDFKRSSGAHIGMAYLLAPDATAVNPTWTLGFGGAAGVDIAVFKHA